MSDERSLQDVLEEHRDECRQWFLSTSAFWRSIVAGIMVVVGMATGVIAWAIHVDSQMAVHESEIRHNKISIDKMEKAINGKLDRILANQEKR